MQTPDPPSPRLTPLCLALAVAAAGGAALATWVALLPPVQERRGATVSADRAVLGTCLTRVLHDSSELAAKGAGTNPPLVSVLSHPGSNASRVVYEGATRLSFVVTLTETAPGHIETRLLTFPAVDPGPAVDKAFAACTSPKG